jgi:hypothetical protein
VEAAEAADTEAEIDVDWGFGSCPYHRRGVVNCEDSEEGVVNCEDSEEGVAALALNLETRCVSYPKE